MLKEIILVHLRQLILQVMEHRKTDLDALTTAACKPHDRGSALAMKEIVGSHQSSVVSCQSLVVSQETGTREVDPSGFALRTGPDPDTCGARWLHLTYVFDNQFF